MQAQGRIQNLLERECSGGGFPNQLLHGRGRSFSQRQTGREVGVSVAPISGDQKVGRRRLGNTSVGRLGVRTSPARSKELEYARMREMLGISVYTYKALTRDRLRIRGIKTGTVSYAHSRASGGDSSIEVCTRDLRLGILETMDTLRHEDTHNRKDAVKGSPDSPSENFAREQARDFMTLVRNAAAYDGVKVVDLTEDGDFARRLIQAGRIRVIHGQELVNQYVVGLFRLARRPMKLSVAQRAAMFLAEETEKFGQWCFVEDPEGLISKM